MSAVKVISLLAAVLAVGVIGVFGENAVSSNSSKPVIFRTAPVYANTSTDSGNSESRVNQKIITEIPLAEQSSNNAAKKQSVSSQGYQLEVLDDDTSEEDDGRRGPRQKGSESGLNIYPTSGGLGSSPSLVDEYIHPEYDDNSAKEDIKEYVPKGRLAYGDIKPTADIGKVRDIFVSTEMATKTQTGAASEDSPTPTPHGSQSQYNLDYEHGPVKFVHNSPIVLKQSSIPLIDASPLSSPLDHPHHHHHHDHHDNDHHGVHGGHEAGYGHGFHHHQQKLKAKPLKPSVVYRDPHDRFDHHDKIRTLDKDHLKHEKDPHHPHNHFEPHVIGKDHEFHAYRHGKKVYFPHYHYDQSKVPECAHKNKYIYNLTFCLDDPHYPIETIVYALKDSGHYAKKLLTDVTYQSADNLVTGLTRAEEEGYTYKHYFGASHAQNDHLDKYKPPYHGYTYSTDYFKKGGYICPSDIYYARPKRAMNTFGKWKVIVNVDHIPEHGYEKEKHGHGGNHGHSYSHDSYEKGQGHGHESYDKGHGHVSFEKEHGNYGKEHGHDSYAHEKDYGHHTDHHGHGVNEHHGHDSYSHSIKKREYKEYKKTYTQTLRLEQCIYPNAPCSYVDSHYHSSCIQKHNFVRLVAWTHHEGIHVDTFKLPIACSCHVRQPIHFYHESGHHQHKHGQVLPQVSEYHGHHHEHAEHHDHGIIKKIY